MNTYSQCAQDLFVEAVMKGKRDGYFLEIGSNHPAQHNNTYLLEKKYNWKGLMVEYDKSFEQSYKVHRKNSIYELNDARLVNYREILDKNNFPENIDYLQIDLDVDNKSTLDTFLLLNNTVLDKYKFATITFEHDIYRGNYFDTQTISREILKDMGYLLVFPNVSVFWEGSYKPFEDWYVHPDLVDMNYINKIITTDSLTVEQIKNIL
uniref:Methyltransferase FkbM domain-containing protein n=1 Tax=viral metagenome TaxID=1070528 RepID=A0A6C0DJJ3_9ZZZZ